MIYKWAVTRNGVLLDRTLTRARASKLAMRHLGAAAVALLFVTGCANPNHGGGAVPCDLNNCGKAPLDNGR